MENNFLIPYKCRCEALGDNKRRGGRFKDISTSKIYSFPDSWENMKIFEKSSKDFSKFLLARPEKFIESADVKNIDGGFEITLKPHEKMPDVVGIEIYDCNLKLCAKKLVSCENFTIEAPLSTRYKILIVTDEETLCVNMGDWSKRVSKECEKIEKVKFEFVDSRLGLIKLTNTTSKKIVNASLNFELYDQEYSLEFGGDLIEEIRAGESKIVKLDYSFPDLSFFELFLGLEICANGKILGLDALKLPVTQSEPEIALSSDMPDIIFAEDDDSFIFTGTGGEDFSYIFNKRTASFTKIERNSVNMLNVPKMSPESDYNVSVIDVNSKFVTMLISSTDCQGMIVVYGDGEIGFSYIGDNISVDFCLDIDIHNILLFGSLKLPDMYNILIENEKLVDDTRMLMCYNDSKYGFMLKGSPSFGLYLKEKTVSLFGKQNLSFYLRPTGLLEEDILREARTIPSIG